MLKIIRYSGCPRRANHNEMVNASKATVKVPAAGPNRSREVKTNVSDMEMVAGTDGSLTVVEPLISVRIARTNQFQLIGSEYRAYVECAMAIMPTTETVATYNLAHRDRG